MAEGPMSAERPKQGGGEKPIATNPNDEITRFEETPSSDLPLDDLTRRSVFIGLPQILRRTEAHQRRDKEAEDKFLLDIEFIERMRTISEVFPASPLSEGEPIKSYDPEEVLDEYKKKDDKDKRDIRANVRTHIEARQRTLLGILTADLRMLYADQGLPEDKIDEKIQELTTDRVNKKRRYLNQLPKEAQIRLLENMADERSRNLIENFDQYMYVLSYSNPFPFTQSVAEDQEDIRNKFAEADDRGKAGISAEVRQKAKVGLRQTFDINLERLEKIKLASGYKIPLIKERISSLKEAYNQAGLPGKVGIVSDIQEQKLNLVTQEQLQELINLRKILEGSVVLADEMEDPSSDQQKIQNETDRIIELTASKATTYGTAIEVEINEARKVIENKATDKEKPNPKLVDTYELALLLRLSTNDYFRF